MLSDNIACFVCFFALQIYEKHRYVILFQSIILYRTHVNIIYDEDGLPLHCAPGGKSDIIFHNEIGSYILEPTMLTSRQQQQNSETTNIVRHVKDEESKTKLKYRVMMIAPCVHNDVADFFQFKAVREGVKITPITIERTIGLLKDSNTLQDLGLNYDEILQLLVNNDVEVYSDLINAYRV